MDYCSPCKARTQSLFVICRAMFGVEESFLPELGGYTFAKVLTWFAMVDGFQGRARFQTIPLRSFGALASPSRAGLKSWSDPYFSSRLPNARTN